MKKILITLFALVITAAIIGCGAKSTAVKPVETKQAKAYTAENYPLKKSHLESGMACQDCHAEDKDYSERIRQDRCFTCHESYDELAKKTSGLGYDDNIHASPHYPKMDCDLCHKVHTNDSVNYCARCHSQDTMTKIIVP